MSSFLNRAPQLQGAFSPGDPDSGYYNDLRTVADGYGTPEQAIGWFEMFALRRERAWPVSLLQLGIGAWQNVQAGAEEWQPVLKLVAEWAAVDMDGYGRFPHHLPMPHTYEIEPPWFSAMAQGQGASLLVRAATSLGQPELLADARRAIAPLLDPELGLVAPVDEGIVLQEYPSDPPAHVLNGWIWALWGLYDTALASAADEPAASATAQAAFDTGVDTLVARLPLYDIGKGAAWSRYDLFPHPVTNVASPFYHRLHVEMLRALHELAPRPELLAAVERWEAGLNSRSARISAVARKVGFRMLRPRKQAA